MILECPCCQRPIIAANGSLRPDRTLIVQTTCSVCGTVYSVEIRELRQSPRSAEEIESRRNKTT